MQSHRPQVSRYHRGLYAPGTTRPQALRTALTKRNNTLSCLSLMRFVGMEWAARQDVPYGLCSGPAGLALLVLPALEDPLQQVHNGFHLISLHLIRSLF